MPKYMQLTKNNENRTRTKLLVKLTQSFMFNSL